jgi:hypothetical protein
MANPRYTSLIPNPPAAPATSTPNSRAPAPVSWDQYRAEKAHNKLVSRESAFQGKVYAVIDAMMAPLELSASEAENLRAVLRVHLYNEVSVQSIEMSVAVLPS